MASYFETRQKATKMGISFHGKTEKELLKEIELVSGAPEGPAVDNEKVPSEHSEKTQVLLDREKAILAKQEARIRLDEKEQLDAKKKKVDTAVLLKGKMVVRTYSLKLHGENFMELAEQFAKRRGCQIDFKFVGTGHRCPTCGHEHEPTT